MNISSKKKAIIVLTIIWAIITFNLIQTTYAKYLTTLDTSTNISISYWKILLNDNNITNATDMTDVLSVVFPGNEYSQADAIVPGSTGYFDLNINSSNTSIPFSITVNSTINKDSALTQDLVITGYSIDDGDIVNLTDTFAFTYNIGADVDSTKVRVYITWQDDDEDSQEDTALGISGGNVLLDVNLIFNQILD